MADPRHRIPKQLIQLLELIDLGDAALQQRSTSVSGWSVAQHVDHLLKVCRGIFTLIERDTHLDGDGVSFRGRAVMFIGIIPRGVAKAPESVTGMSSSAQELKSMFGEVDELAYRTFLRADVITSRKKIFRHPYFRNLTSRESLRFIEVHNDHHLKIIREIQHASRSG